MTTAHYDRVTEALGEVSFNNWEFVTHCSEDRVYIFAVWVAHDNFGYSCRPAPQQTRRWLIRPDASKSEIVQTAFKCVMTAMEHEVREQFLYRDRAVFGPHHDVDKLWSIANHMAYGAIHE